MEKNLNLEYSGFKANGFVMLFVILAAMVSNLLVVLCSDESAQPVVNAGTINN